MITFFHGLVGSPHNWDQVLRLLPKKNISTYNPVLKYTDHALMEIIDTVKLKCNHTIDVHSKRVAVGNSLGCLVALGVAKDVDKIILTAPPFQFDNRFIPRERGKLEAYAKSLYGKKHVLSQEEEEMFSKAALDFSQFLSSRENIQKMRRIKQEILSLNMGEILQRFQDKIHFVVGSDDQISPLDAFLKFHKETSPRSELSIIADCGHAVPLEQPSKLAKIIEAYL